MAHRDGFTAYEQCFRCVDLDPGFIMFDAIVEDCLGSLGEGIRGGRQPFKANPSDALGAPGTLTDIHV